MSRADITLVDAAAWEQARQVLPVIRRLAEKSDRTRADVEAGAAEMGCGPTHAYALLRRYLADPRLTSLLPHKPGPAPGFSKLTPDVDRLVGEMIDEFYLTRQKPLLSDLVSEVRRQCIGQGLVPPSRKAITARVRARPARAIEAGREGAKLARSRYLPAIGSLEAKWPLSLVQIDHTLVDVIVVDSETRAPIQRPWLTLAIDVCTRCVAGFHLSLEPPSATSVALCLTQAVLPKEGWLAERNIDAEWPVQGLIERLHLDNAKEFRSEALKRGCEEYGIGIDHRPVRTPHYGGHIERLIGTMMGKVHLLPGTTFSDIRVKGDLDPEKTAAMTLEEVERWLGHAIAGVYHRQLHRGIMTTPLAAWQRGISGDGKVPGRGEPVAVVNPRRFLIDFLPIAWRMVRREGVLLHSIAYWADVLSTWIGTREPMMVRFDPRDLSRIYLLGPDGTYYDLAYRDLRRPPISLWEQRQALKRLREDGRALVDEEAIFRAVDSMRRIADEAVQASKAARRQRERRPRPRQGVASDRPAIADKTGNPDAAPGERLQPHERMLPFEEW
jgi:putative transposase